jgi:hypothetical protein
MQKNIIDVAIIGGGIFGAEIAVKAKHLGLSVKIIEQRKNILSGASANNQNRLHLGFHYPRDLETGRQCIRGFDAFKQKYSSCIQDGFLNAYFISKEGSLTSSDDFIEFSSLLGVPYNTIEADKFPIEVRNTELALSCEEVVYDCSILRDIVWENINTSGVDVELGIRAKKISRDNDLFKIEFDNFDPVLAKVVINASYADINNLTKQLNYPVEERLYEYTIVAIIELDIPKLGITIMDGPFMTLLPYGKTGNYLLYCVDHSVIKKEIGPIMDQSWLIPELSPFSSIDKKAYFKNMIDYCKKYVPVLDKANLKGFLEGPRMVLANKDDTDERPSLITNYDNNYFTVFSGKIDHSIWVADEVVKSLKERFAK